MTAGVADGITLAQLEVDPYPAYARLRREAPVCWVPAANVWFVTRWDDCVEVGRDIERFRGARTQPTLDRVFGTPNVRTAAGEVHAELRRAIDPQLRPRAVREYIEELARPLAQECLAAMRAAGRAEVMSSYFEPVSVRALGDVLGLREIDALTLRRWFHGLNDGISNYGRDPDRFAAADRVTAEIEKAVDPILERLRREPDESILGQMTATPRELILPSLKVILLGGMQEPGHAAGTTLLGLLSRPDQLVRVVADAALVPDAINEGLRWIAPIGAVGRETTRETRVGGVDLPAGTTAHMILASANRDEARFEDPDTFDLDRRRVAGGHMSFGHGEHFCSGHFFARQLERIMLEELLTLPGLALDPDVEPLVRGWAFRAPKRLGVTWSGSSA